MTKLTIEMVSDLVCPWCWLGLRRIQSAIALVPEIEVELLFRPFELDPTIPEGGVNYRDYMASKFGPETEDSRWAAMREALVQYGQEEDIPYNFSELRHRPNSFDAHRLVRWAQGQGKGAEEERLKTMSRRKTNKAERGNELDLVLLKFECCDLFESESVCV